MLMKNKTSWLSAKLRPVLVAILLLIVLVVPRATAQTSQAFCTAMINGPGAALSNYATLDKLVGISVLIMLAMAMVAAIAYMLGYSFRVGKLVSFGKQEIGEIVVTALIVLIFIGTFAMGGAFTPPKITTSSGAYSTAIFVSDCEGLANASLSLIPVYISVMVAQDLISVISSLTIKIEPEFFGGSFSPFAGYATVNNSIGILLNLSGAIAGLLIGMAVLMAVFYAILPFFLFAGIVLRTLPFTRAAGGAFLGLFAAFYIFFPILLHFMLATLPPSAAALGTSNFSSIFGGASGFASSPGSAFGTFISVTSGVLSPTTLLSTVVGILVANFYAVFALIFALIISFDFMEAMGDLLGSPSLSSRNTLNRLL